MTVAAATRGIAITAGVALGCIGLVNSFLVSERALAYSPLALAGANPNVHIAAYAIAQHLPASLEARFLAALSADTAEEHPNAAMRARAEQAVAALLPGRDRDSLTARDAVLRGDYSSALHFALRAGDFAIAEKTLDALENRGERDAAAAGVQALLRATNGVATARESFASGLWRAARLENYAADHAISRGQRLSHRNAALAYLRRQLVLTPLSGQALLTAGYAELDVTNAEAARRYFRKALASDPASASAYVGLARIALAEHDQAAARTAYERAQTLAPAQDDVVRLGRDL